MALRRVPLRLYPLDEQQKGVRERCHVEPIRLVEGIAQAAQLTHTIHSTEAHSHEKRACLIQLWTGGQ